jgi:hypothetical protein
MERGNEDKFYHLKPANLIYKIDNEKALIEFEKNYFLLDIKGNDWYGKDEWRDEDGVVFYTQRGGNSKIYLIKNLELELFRLKVIK